MTEKEIDEEIERLEMLEILEDARKNRQEKERKAYIKYLKEKEGKFYKCGERKIGMIMNVDDNGQVLTLEISNCYNIPVIEFISKKEFLDKYNGYLDIFINKKK